MATPIDPKAAEELAKKMQDVKNASNEATRAFQEQLRIIQQMRDAMSQVATNMGAMCQQECAALSPEVWEEVTKAVEKNNDAMTESSKTTKQLSDATKKVSKESKDFGKISSDVGTILQSKVTKGAIIATGALKGLGQGISNLTALAKGFSNVFGSIFGLLYDIGKAVANAGKAMYIGLGKMANAGAGGNELAAAYQEVVKTFGTLNSGSGKSIVKAAHNIDKLNQTGISSLKIFGTMAERVKAAKEMADGLGSAMSYYRDEVEKNGGAMLIFNKGLGITAEQMSGIATNAMRMGKSITAVQIDMTKHAVGMAKAFQLDAKVLSKDMAKAMQDLAHFGHLSTKEMAVTAAFAQKMGVSIDKLVGVMDSTKTFDQTAEGMSKLNEQFHTNIDFTEIMSAQSPEEKIAMLSKEFARAGVDLKHLTIQQKDLIKSSAGVDDAMLASMAANGDMTESLKELRKEADKNEESTMDQKKAMKELAKGIEVLTPSGGGMQNDVFSNVIEGISRGIQLSPKFIKLMAQIRENFRNAIQFGAKLGKMFMDWGDGAGSVMDGLLKIFNPATYKRLFDDLFGAFETLKKGGPEAVEEFFNQVTKAFMKFFTSDKEGVGLVGEGLKNMGETVLNTVSKVWKFVVKGLKVAMPLILQALKDFGNWLMGPGKDLAVKFGDMFFKALADVGNMAVDQIKKIIPMVTEAIKDFFKFLFGPAAKNAANGITAKAADWFGPLFDVIKRLAVEVVPMLWDAVKDILSTLAELIKENPEIVAKAVGAMLVIAFGPALLGAALSAISAALIGSIGAMLTGVGMAVSLTVGPAFAAFGAALLSALSGAAIIAAVGYAAVNVGDSIKKYGDTLEKKGFDPATSKIAAGATGLINTITFGLLPEDMQQKVAESIAKGADIVFKTLTEYLGPSFSTSLKERLASAFQVFGGIGNLIVSLWKGDSKGTEQAFRDIGEGVLKFVISSFEFLEVEIPLAVFKIGAWLLKGFGSLGEWVFGGLADLFHKLEKVPVLGPLFGLIGDIFSRLKALFGGIKSFFGGVINFLNLIDIPGIFKGAWDAISNFFKDSKDGANGFLSGFFEWGKKLLSIFESTFQLIRDLFNVVFSWDLNKSLFENLKDKINGIWQAIKDYFVRSWSNFKDVFIKGPSDAWDWMVKNFSWEKFKGIIGSIVDGAKEQFDKIKDYLSNPFKAGLKLVKTFLGISSPSKEMADVGKDIADGLKDGTSKIPEDMKNTAADASKALSQISPTGTPAPPGGASITPEQIKNTEKIIEAVISLAGKIPVDASIKAKLEGLNQIFESLDKMKEALSVTATGGGGLEGLNNNLHYIFNVLQTLNGETRTKDKWIPSLNDLTTQFEKLGVSKLSADNAVAVGSLLENMNKITKTISDASSSVALQQGEGPLQAIGRQLNFVYGILMLLSGQEVNGVKSASLASLTSLLDKLSITTTSLQKADQLIQISEKLTALSTAMSTIPDNMNSVKEAFSKMSDNAFKINTEGMVENIKAVQEMVAKTRELDAALSRLPDLKFPAKLETIANGMGIGGKFAYTVQSKEVVINVAFEVSMDVDKVEKVIITRQQSIIRDRLNFIMDNTLRGNSNTSSALVKSTGQQGGLVAPNAAP